MKDRCTRKTKLYVVTYGLRKVVAKKKLFDFVACDSLDDATRKRKYKINKRKKEARIRVEMKLKKK